MLLKCLFACGGCIGFAFIFKMGRNYKFIAAGSIIGFIGSIAYFLIRNHLSEFVSTFIAMLIIAVLSEIMARIFKAPAIIFITIAYIPFVPGKGIYYTMYYGFLNNKTLFMENLISTISIGVAIALGILCANTIFQLFSIKIKKNKYKCNKEGKIF